MDRFFRGNVYGTCVTRVGVWAKDKEEARSLIEQGRWADAEEPNLYWEHSVEDLVEIERKLLQFATVSGRMAVGVRDGEDEPAGSDADGGKPVRLRIQDCYERYDLGQY